MIRHHLESQDDTFFNPRKKVLNFLRKIFCTCKEVKLVGMMAVFKRC